VRSTREAEPTAIVLIVILVAVVVSLAITKGIQPLAQTTINGLTSGSYIALGAAGLTLVFAALRLVNFAYGDYLTFGAYVALIVRTRAGAPLVVAGIAAVVATAAFSVGLELALWRPLRKRGTRNFQLMIVALGLAYIIRYTIQFFAGANERSLSVDITSSYKFAGLHIGTTELIVVLVGYAAIIATALMLRSSTLGRQMRALADNITLARTTGINAERVALLTWGLSGALAGLGGILLGSTVGFITPNLGFSIVLSIFAAAVIGGVGRPYGALVGGVLVGAAQEWSTLVITPQLKTAAGFVVMIAVLILRPQGLLGRTVAADR
jgi:neutral amino acid transport system permease protein